jgi:DNA-directed RNA polymerase
MIFKKYRDKIIWFPHSLDFRGRSYPIPPHFNHLGSDIARSLILFGEGKKLGAQGLDTLMLHLINLTGTMKRSSLAERIEYAKSILDDIVDSAERPFDGRLWWQKSEEKWQTLGIRLFNIRDSERKLKI